MIIGPLFQVGLYLQNFITFLEKLESKIKHNSIIVVLYFDKEKKK